MHTPDHIRAPLLSPSNPPARLSFQHATRQYQPPTPPPLHLGRQSRTRGGRPCRRRRRRPLQRETDWRAGVKNRDIRLAFDLRWPCLSPITWLDRSIVMLSIAQKLEPVTMGGARAQARVAREAKTEKTRQERKQHIYAVATDDLIQSGTPQPRKGCIRQMQ